MDMQETYIWTYMTSNAQFPYTFFGFNACRHSSQITLYNLKFVFCCGCFLISSSNVSKTSLFRTLVYDDFYKFNWKRFHSNYSRFFQKWLFCKAYVLYNISLSVAKILEKHIWSSSCLLYVFFRENSHSRGKFTKQLFLLQFLYVNCLNRYF